MAKIEVELKPFQVPNFVVQAQPTREGGLERAWDPLPSYPLNAIDAYTLAEMCDEFRAAVFEKARRLDPARSVPVVLMRHGS